MAIKRYIADADTTITNAYKSNLTTRGTGSNMGRADSMAIFSIYGQESTGSTELSRTLLNFPLDSIGSDRDASVLPGSGSVKFYLKMFNAVTPFTVPRDFVLTVSAVSATAWPGNFSWQEGSGIDMENYSDVTRNGIGANWMNVGSSSAGGLVTWQNVGGDYYADASSSFTVGFNNGTENLELDISPLVEQWLGAQDQSPGNVLGEKKNYGLGVRLSPEYEAYFSSSLGTATGSIPQNTAGAHRSYYTKKFFARSSAFFYKRPYIEARWDSATKDYRGSFFYSSSLATADENLNTVYLYNYFRGQLRNIPDIGTGNIYVSVHSGSIPSGPSGSALVFAPASSYVLGATPTVVTGGHVSTGVYSASFAITASSSPLDYLFDVWHNDAGIQYQTGTIAPETISLSAQNADTTYVTNITNLKSVYRTTETARFRVFTRDKNWYPNIYTRAYASVSPLIIDSGSYAVTRVIDGVEAVTFGTGSDLQTQMSFDISGSFFDLDIGMLQPGYSYKMNFAFYNGSIADWVVQPQEFKFRVEE